MGRAPIHGNRSRSALAQRYIGVARAPLGGLLFMPLKRHRLEIGFRADVSSQPFKLARFQRISALFSLNLDFFTLGARRRRRYVRITADGELLFDTGSLASQEPAFQAHLTDLQVQAAPISKSSLLSFWWARGVFALGIAQHGGV